MAHNTRSPQQWDIISKHVEFQGLNVVDLGCGYGDLLSRIKRAGAAYVLGVDHEIRPLGIPIVSQDIHTYCERHPVDLWDVALCFSVLPYLVRMEKVLGWMYAHAEKSLIEVQYFGDGPGPQSWPNDAFFKKHLLSVGWETCTPIGKTLVEDRNKERTIWLCQKG